MRIHQSISDLPSFRNAVITIGTFDGVHSGHRAIIQQMLAEAETVNGETVIITFHPHPRKIIGKGANDLSLLNSLEEKSSRLSLLGIDHLVIIPFTDEFASMSAESYVRDFLVTLFHPSKIIIGYDHRFGNGRTGDFRLLESLGEKYAFQVVEIPAHIQNAVTISSTQIRNLLKDGQIEKANAFLGYPYMISGTVTEGDKRGRTIGFPTANILLLDKEKLLPADGVYAITVMVKDALYKGMMNIGYRPTVSGTFRSVEVNIFDFDAEIYGEVLQVWLYGFIRAEIKFPSLDALKAQLKQDKEKAEELLKSVSIKD